MDALKGKRPLTPGVGAIQQKYVESILNYIILRVLGLLTKEELETFGDITLIDEFLERIRRIISVFIPYIFILDTLSNRPRVGGIIDTVVHSAKQTLLWLGREAPHVGSTIGILEPIEGGILGELIGWAIAMPFWVLGTAVGVSSKDPKYTMKSIAGMIPVVGTDIQNTIDAVDSSATRAVNKSFGVIQGLKDAGSDVLQNSSYLKNGVTL
jgi:hypothetical protein